MDDTPAFAPSDAPNGKKILCIEDEHFISELYSRALRQAGYEVTIIVDGEVGLKEALSDQYDIILLDLMIPNMIGTDILKRLRGPGSTPVKATIIITTNLEQDDAGREAIESLADGYVVKAEMTPKQLVTFLRQLHA